MRDELERLVRGSTGVDELVHGLLAYTVELAREHPGHPLLTALATQLGQGASLPMIAAAIHDLRAVLQGVAAGLEVVPGLLERSGALGLAQLEPNRIDGRRLALALEALDDARAGLRTATELAAETLALQRDCLATGRGTSPTGLAASHTAGRPSADDRAERGPTAGEVERRGSRTCLAEVVRAAGRLAGRQVDLRLRLDAPATLEVQAPRRDLLRVLINLLRNATQAIAELADPTTAGISVSTWASDELAFVQIADQGPGIPAATLDAIFELFFTTHGEGTGVGLFVCQALVSGWGGRIHVDSRPGDGARFTFSVPRAAGGPDPRR